MSRELTLILIRRVLTKKIRTIHEVHIYTRFGPNSKNGVTVGLVSTVYSFTNIVDGYPTSRVGSSHLTLIEEPEGQYISESSRNTDLGSDADAVD